MTHGFTSKWIHAYYRTNRDRTRITQVLRKASGKDASTMQAAQPKRGGQSALVGESDLAKGVVCAPLPLRVRISRIYLRGRERDYDFDNLVGGCKSVRDAVALFLGSKDDGGKSGLAFEYAQRPTERGESPGIEITVERT